MTNYTLYTEHLRRRLDQLLSAANAIDFEAGKAANAWQDYQHFSRNPSRQSTYVKRVDKYLKFFNKV